MKTQTENIGRTIAGNIVSGFFLPEQILLPSLLTHRHHLNKNKPEEDPHISPDALMRSRPIADAKSNQHISRQ